MGMTFSTHGASRNAYRILVGKPEGRPRRRWKENIKMDFREVSCDVRYCIDLAQDRAYVRAVINLRVP